MSNCYVVGSDQVFAVICSAEAMWDDPWSKGLADYLNAVAEREWREREQELDLKRERELNPPTEEIRPVEIPAEMVLDWDAYG
jgi:hypothetical protein